MPDFVHLHVHSTYSLLQSTASIEALVQRAAEEGHTHLALTDTLALHGAVSFQKACKAHNIHPVIGMTLPVSWSDDIPAPDDFKTHRGTLILLAQTPEGYRSLCRLTSDLHLGREDDADIKAVPLQNLRNYAEGVICIDGGRRGWLERCLRAGQKQCAHRYVGRLAGIFDERAFLGLEVHYRSDHTVAKQIVKLGTFLGVQPVVLHPIYNLESSDRKRLRLLTAIRLNCKFKDVPDSALPNDGDPAINTHWMEPDAFEEHYAAYPEALVQSLTIAKSCGDVLPDGRLIWPSLDIPNGQSVEQALETRTREGLQRNYGDTPSDKAVQRLERELDAIARYGYSPLFLIVSDIVRYAREKQIPVSTRGSVANSIVAYCAGITTIDPIEHDLLFERFLSPARTDLPDIDLDFCSRRRDEVLNYVRQRYGEDRVAQLATISTLQPRSAVREVAKAYNIEESKIKSVLSKLPHRWHPDPRRRDNRTVDEVVAGLDDINMQDIVREAYELVGQPDHLSVHPGGVVITPGPLTNTLPIQRAAMGVRITQYDHKDVDALGLPKLDLLGIRALTVLADTAELVRQHHQADFTLDSIPDSDPQTVDTLRSGDTIGVFQCESEGARRTLQKLKASSVRDLAVANAFFKPGPATGGMANAFVRRYRGEAKVSFLHSTLEPILGPTFGILLFQEQIMRVATEIAGLSWQQAGFLRRGMSKMQHAEMENMREAFITGCQRPEPEGSAFSPEQAKQLWEQVEAFSGYGFNQGHATAYANVSYRTAYVRAHWPAAFFCARLQSWGGFHHPAVYMAEAMRLGITIHAPHLNSSKRNFELEWIDGTPHLWMGLNFVRDVRKQTIRDLITAREQGPFTNMRDVLTRVPLRSKELLHLVKIGAFDKLGDNTANRNQLIATAERFIRAGNFRQLAFDFADAPLPPAPPRLRAVWEKQLMGYPLTALQDWLPELAVDEPEAVSLTAVKSRRNRKISAVVARMPGRSGGGSIYLWDGITWVMAKVEQGKRNPTLWQPLKVTGHLHQDSWGVRWLQVQNYTYLSEPY